MFPVLEAGEPIATEQLGSKKKFWYTDGSGRRMLFKAEERGYGEDWSEKVVCELAAMLGIPHVHYELAFNPATGDPGVVSEFMGLQGQTLVHGNTLMQLIDSEYPVKVLRVPAHTVDAVYMAVRMLELPERRWAADLPKGFTTGVEVFAGYLMLDAWVANQDRHHENWGAIWTGEELALAPSYDHGAALARNISDKDREARLRTKDQGYSIAAFARRGASRIFANGTDKQPLRALDAFRQFSAPIEDAAAAWIARLRLVDEGAVARVLAEVPPDRLSAVGREFTLQLLLENQKRILAPRDEWV